MAKGGFVDIQIERGTDLSLSRQSVAADEFAAAAWSKGVRNEALGNLAHELRTPVQVLMGYIDILREEAPAELGEETREIFERMNSNVYDLARTVENLMES